jgi:ketosteroid isomerase-like protein
VEENVLFAEFFLSGTPINTGKPFTIASSAALITCQAGQVVRYRDFPNSAGIAQALGNLANYIALLNDVNRH